MRDERGNIAGNQFITEPFTLWGSIAGNVSVSEGGKFYVRGAIYGNLDVLPGGRVHIFGNVSGNLTMSDKTKVIHSGLQPRRTPLHRRHRQGPRQSENLRG